LKREVSEKVIQEIGTLELQTITHALIGGYNTNSRSEELGIDEFPRPTSVRGAIRWWLRTLLAGACWSAGEKQIEEKVREKTRELMGSSGESSKVAVRLEYGTRPDVVPAKNQLSEVPRLKLLLLGRQRLYCYKPGWNIKLHLIATESIDEKARRVILWSATLCSIFGGIGAITRRGFGALKIEKIDGEDDIWNLVTKIYQNPDTPKLREIVEKSLEDARNFLGVLKRDEPNELPPFPLLSMESSVFRSEFVNTSVPSGSEEVESANLLSKIGRSTLKIEWKLADGKSPRASGIKYDTWILGLPRAVGNTGYFEVGVERREGRRISAINIKPFKRVRDGEWTLLIYGFLSRDWPSQLEIRPSGTKIYVNDKKKREAFEEAWRKIKVMVS
jgi:CRISPR type III-B/RAMP module RAMP protein Cmr1